MIRAVIFDLDGTLIHSTPDMHAALARLLEEEGKCPLDLATITSFVGNGLPKLVERVIVAAGLDIARHDEISERALALYNEENGRRTAAYPGVEACLSALADAGITMGICTNKPEAPARHILAHLGLDHHFPAIVGGDTLSVRKPDPAPLRHMMELLQVDPVRTLYVGDSETDAETATNACLRFALYTHGYRKTPIEAFGNVLAFDHFDRLSTHILTTQK